MNPPSVVIRVEFERIDPVAFYDYLDDGDEARMGAWLEQRSDSPSWSHAPWSSSTGSEWRDGQGK